MEGDQETRACREAAGSGAELMGGQGIFRGHLERRAAGRRSREAAQRWVSSLVASRKLHQGPQQGLHLWVQRLQRKKTCGNLLLESMRWRRGRGGTNQREFPLMKIDFKQGGRRLLKGESKRDVLRSCSKQRT